MRGLPARPHTRRDEDPIDAEPGDAAAPPTDEEEELVSDAPVDDNPVEFGVHSAEQEARREEAAVAIEDDQPPPVPHAAPGEGVDVDAEEREPVARTLVPRWVQLVLLPISLLALWAFARLAGKVLLLFILAGLIALILNPVVAFVQRLLPRGLAVLTVYVGFFLFLVGLGIALANPISDQVSSFTDNLPHLTKEANTNLFKLQHTLNHHGLHVRFIKSGETALQALQDKVSKVTGSLVTFGGGLVTSVVSTGFDIVVTFVLSIYMLIYGQHLGALARRLMPVGDGTTADDYPTLVQQAVTHYVRGQLLFSLIMGTTTGLALYFFGLLGIFPAGRTYAVAFGAFMGLMEFVPYIGPLLGALPPILVALFTDPISALWVALLFLGLQQLEGHIVAPQIFSHSLRINPLLVIFALLCGQQLYGVVGAIIALPIMAILRETAVYLSRHLALEPWDRSPGPLL